MPNFTAWLLTDKNYQWIFSGIGVAALSAFVGVTKWIRSKQPVDPASQRTTDIQQRLGVSQSAGNQATQVNAGGNVIVNNNFAAPPLTSHQPTDSQNTTLPENQKPDPPKVFSSSGDERAIWLLPRGFLVIYDISSHNGQVTAEYYDYNGKFHGGTYYCGEFKKEWPNQDGTTGINFRKLHIPYSDRAFAKEALYFMQEINDRDSSISAEDFVKTYTESGKPVRWYGKDETLYLPPPLAEFSQHRILAPLRDLAYEISEFLDDDNFDPGEWEDFCVSIKVRSTLKSIDAFGENSFQSNYVRETADKYPSKIKPDGTYQWLNELRTVLGSVTQNR